MSALPPQSGRPADAMGCPENANSRRRMPEGPLAKGAAKSRPGLRKSATASHVAMIRSPHLICDAFLNERLYSASNACPTGTRQNKQFAQMIHGKVCPPAGEHKIRIETRSGICNLASRGQDGHLTSR